LVDQLKKIREKLKAIAYSMLCNLLFEPACYGPFDTLSHYLGLGKKRACPEP